jgi:biopolymer transport protein TolQ
MTQFTFIAAFLFFQDDPAPEPAAHGNAIVEMLHNSGPVAMVVLALLLVASLYSWAIIIGKLGTFKRARAQSAKFLRAFRKATRLQEIATVSEQFRPSPLVAVFDEVYETYRRQSGGFGPPQSLSTLERSAQTASSESITVLESRLTWLATIGSTSPYLGLFGTVMGIVDAFHGLGSAGAATLRAVAPGVSEALITTAAGIAVAVPAVVAYNQFTARIREFSARNDDFARELLNSMEEFALRPQETAGQQYPEPARGVHQ